MDNRHLFLSAGSLLLAGTAPAARPAIPATGDPFPWLGVLGSILLGALGLGLLQWFRQRRL